MKHYETPQISVFGSVETLTQGKGSGDVTEFVYNQKDRLVNTRTDKKTCGYTNNAGTRDILCS
jgi:hypothetical protein